MACNTDDCTNTAAACASSAGEPVGTSSAEALACNASKLDVAMNSLDHTFISRNGKTQLTYEGAVSQFGFGVATFDFATGGTLDSINTLVLNSDGFYYHYTGNPANIPLVIAPGFDPTASGDWEAFTATSHNLLAGRNPADGSAHNAEDINAASGFTLEESLTLDTATLSGLISRYGVNAWVQAVFFQNLLIDVDDTKSSTYSIPAGQNIVFSGATITQSGNLPCFEAVHSNWSISGLGNIAHSSGTLPATQTIGQIGVNVTSAAFTWSIGGDIRIRFFGESGIKFRGDGLVAGLTGRSKVTGITCDSNYDNYTFLAGFPAEYLTLSNCISTYAKRYGVYEETGNITWTGGLICYNEYGVWLEHPANGANPHHGSFTGTLINHNIETQLTANSCAAGYIFNGCHFYDNETPGKGMIDLNSSRGVSIIGGVIGCNVQTRDDGFAVHYGYNVVRNNRVDRSKAIITGVGFDRTKLFVSDNYDFAGDWAFNDYRKAFALKRATAAAPLTGVTSYNLLISGLDTAAVDNRGALATGNFVTPFLGLYSSTIAISFTLSAPASGSETVTVSRDDTASGTFTTLFEVLFPAGVTSFSATVDLPFPVSLGGQLSSFLLNATPSTTYTVTAGSQIAYLAD